MTFLPQDIIFARSIQKIPFHSESPLPPTVSSDEKIVDTAQVHHEATNAKFKETETIREGIEKTRDKTLFEYHFCIYGADPC